MASRVRQTLLTTDNRTSCSIVHGLSELKEIVLLYGTSFWNFLQRGCRLPLHLAYSLVALKHSQLVYCLVLNFDIEHSTISPKMKILHSKKGNYFKSSIFLPGFFMIALVVVGPYKASIMLTSHICVVNKILLYISCMQCGNSSNFTEYFRTIQNFHCYSRSMTFYYLEL